MRTPIRLLLCAVLAVVLLSVTGCSTRLVPLPDPTQIPVNINATADTLRTQVASTVQSSTTQTAAALPTVSPATDTPEPTATPESLVTLPPQETATPLVLTSFPTMTAVPTMVMAATSTRAPVVWVPSATPIQTDYQCALSSQSITWGMKIRAGVDFDSVWTIINTGAKDWDAGDVSYEYISGAKVNTKDEYTLSKGVDTDDKVNIIVDMIAPKEIGYYQATWGVYHGNKLMCTLDVTFATVQP